MKFKSQLVTQASGSIGGATFARNRGGLYVRARSVPVNPNTGFQSDVRGYFSNAVGRWNDALTQAQRDGWNLYAEQVPLTDSLGDPRNIGGLPMYIRSNTFRRLLGLPFVDAPPTLFSLPFAGGFAALPLIDDGEDPSELQADIPASGNEWLSEVGAAMGIFISRPQNPGVNFYKGPFRFIGSVLGSGTPSDPTPVALPVPFDFQPGQVFFVRYRVTRADGRLSSAVILRSTEFA
jgi:hypothetical protein